ncbi:hypothetical protein RSAG8_12983, partial [Rhizoctonia solani AG-8 WAC10335]
MGLRMHWDCIQIHHLIQPDICEIENQRESGPLCNHSIGGKTDETYVMDVVFGLA